MDAAKRMGQRRTPGRRLIADERPILFSAPMVQALLAGRKTQTRRPVDMSRLSVTVRGTVKSEIPPYDIQARGKKRVGMNPHGAVYTLDEQLGLKPGEFDFVCPYASGRTHLADHGGGRKIWTITPEPSRLWVRETWQCHDLPALSDAMGRGGASVYYRADAMPFNEETLTWRPGIHMPRAAARLILDVTSVRIERLNDITEADAKAEGIGFDGGGYWGVDGDMLHHDARGAFIALWRRINDARPGCAWSDNPWVWVVSFKPTEETA